jgi:ABC-type polar amino acid transport system ATPase subunit
MALGQFGSGGSTNIKAKAALAKANTVTLSVEGIYENDRQKFSAMAQDLGVTFDGNNNVLDNTIKDNTAANTAHKNATGNPHGTGIADISGLQSELDSKQDTISGYTGSIAVVTSVDFTAKTTAKKTVTVTNGVITGVS